MLLAATPTPSPSPTERVLIDVGPVALTTEQVAAGLAALGRVALILIASYVVVKVLHRIVDKAVADLVDRDSGPIDRLRRRKHPDVDSPPVMHPSERDIAFERRSRRTVALANVGKSIISVTVWTLSTFSVLGTFGLDLGPYIAGLGIVGVALGFGAQDLVKDFISGVFMLLEDQYGVGDVIDAGDAIGTVEGVTLRTTRVRGVDGTLWFVPNGEIRRLGNMSQEWASALLDVGVAYDTDTDHASRVIEEVARTMVAEDQFAAHVLGEPQVLGVQNLGADAVDIRLTLKTTPGDQYMVARELRARIKKALDAEGIEIPYPQRTVWVRQDGAAGPNADPAADLSAQAE